MNAYESWLARREEARWEDMRACDMCGVRFDRDDLEDGLCPACAEVDL